MLKTLPTIMAKVIKSILHISRKITSVEFTLQVTKDAKQASMTMSITSLYLKNKLKQSPNLLIVVPKVKLSLCSLQLPHSSRGNVNRKKRCKRGIKWTKYLMLAIPRLSTMRNKVTLVKYLKTMTLH